MQHHVDYGIDAPGAVRGLALIGVVLGTVAAAAPFPAWLGVGLAVLAGLCLLYAAVMVASSLVGKKRIRDRLVAALALSADEQVLDAGCGRGLALIGCAKALTTGKVIGIDLWSAKDLSRNSPAATRANAVLEGVADRVEVETGDITQLPFSDASFDAVISMTVIHNIPSAEARDQALRELVRVLKPGGRIALFDILHAPHYAALLQRVGLVVRWLGRDLLWFLPCGSLLAQKPAR